MRIAAILSNVAIFGVALLYLVLIAMPVEYCLTRVCEGADLDGFMPAFAFSIIGIPVLIEAIFKCLGWCFPCSSLLPRIRRAVWLLLAALVVAGLIALRLSHR